MEETLKLQTMWWLMSRLQRRKRKEWTAGRRVGRKEGQNSMLTLPTGNSLLFALTRSQAVLQLPETSYSLEIGLSALSWMMYSIALWILTQHAWSLTSYGLTNLDPILNSPSETLVDSFSSQKPRYFLWFLQLFSLLTLDHNLWAVIYSVLHMSQVLGDGEIMIII